MVNWVGVVCRVYGITTGKLKNSCKVCDDEGTTGLLKVSNQINISD